MHISRELRPVFTFKPIFLLRSHRQHKHRVDCRHIAMRGTTDDKFAFAVFHGPPDQGAVGQDLDGFQNVANALSY